MRWSSDFPTCLLMCVASTLISALVLWGWQSAKFFPTFWSKFLIFPAFWPCLPGNVLYLSLLPPGHCIAATCVAQSLFQGFAFCGWHYPNPKTSTELWKKRCWSLVWLVILWFLCVTRFQEKGKVFQANLKVAVGFVCCASLVIAVSYQPPHTVCVLNWTILSFQANQDNQFWLAAC